MVVGAAGDRIIISYLAIPISQNSLQPCVAVQHKCDFTLPDGLPLPR